MSGPKKGIIDYSIYPEFDKEFSITCDASTAGLGAILEQEGHVVAYASRTRNKTEKRWSATALELDAVVFGCKTFRFYILGRNTKIYTNHMPLRGTMYMQEASARIARLMQKLAEYDVEIIYKKVKENQNADFLSRMNEPEVVKNRIQEAEQYYTVTRHQAWKSRNEPEKDPEEKGSQEGTPEEKEDQGNWERGEEEKGGRNIEKAEEETDETDTDNEEPNIQTQTITDEHEKETILWDNHKARLTGHFGVTKTYNRIRQRFQWPGLLEDIREYIRKCTTCQKTKPDRATKMPLGLVDVPEKPFDKINIDIVGPSQYPQPGTNTYSRWSTD